MDALVRPYRSEDLGQVAGLWESAGEAWPGLDASMRLLLDAGAVCVIAETHGRVVGCGLGVVAGGVGWIWRTDAASNAVAAEQLEALVAALADAGAELVTAASRNGAALAERGFSATGAALFERVVVKSQLPPELSAVGGRIVPPGLWDEPRGMDEAKEIIERRVILPLAEPELAARHAVEQPKAIVLFGPSRSSLPRSAPKALSGRPSSLPRPSTACSSYRRPSSSSTRSRTSPRCATKSAGSARTSRTSS